jgi:translation initiation factor 2-alpha kinase 4
VEAESLAAAQRQQELEAEKRARELNQQIQLSTQQKEASARQAIEKEQAQKRQELLSTLADGEFEDRSLHLSDPLLVPPFTQAYIEWILFGGKKCTLWTEYTAEPKEQFLKTSLPRVTMQVVDFANPYYNTAHGIKKIDTIVTEVTRAMEVDSEYVIRILGVERSKSPKGFERLIILVEQTEGVLMNDDMPQDGYGEEIARVSVFTFPIILTNAGPDENCSGLERDIGYSCKVFCSKALVAIRLYSDR